MKIKIFSDTILADKNRQKQIEKLAAKGKMEDDIEYRVNQFISGKKLLTSKQQVREIRSVVAKSLSQYFTKDKLFVFTI